MSSTNGRTEFKERFATRDRFEPNERLEPNESSRRVSALRFREERFETTDNIKERYDVEEKDEEEYCYVQTRSDSPRLFRDSAHTTTTLSLDDRERSSLQRDHRKQYDSERSLRNYLYRDEEDREAEFEETRQDYSFREGRSSTTSGAFATGATDSTVVGDFQNRGLNMSVDYSPFDFRQSLAAIDAASRESIKVHREGDTTVITEHRDPYSFYWQLDQARQQEEEPPRRPLQNDYVIDEENIVETVMSPDSHDSGIQVERESQYSRPIRPIESPFLKPPIKTDDNPPPPMKPLPHGWEKHKDPSGYSYYWHVDSGTIQRQPPQGLPEVPHPAHPVSPPSTVRTVQTHSRETQVDDQTSTASIPPPSYPPPQPVIEEHAFKQTTVKRQIDNFAEDDEEDDDELGKPVRFAVRSLGWTEIPEEDLTPERSSRAVNRAIVDLSTGRNDIMDNISKWGDGRELIMELDDNDLTLIDPDTMTKVHSERIQQIRVWGVGRDNGRDFAYVARDRNSRRFMCHVFRCDTPARTIANTLRDICKRLMLQKRPNTLSSIDYGERRLVARESSLPTPIDEPKKIIRCHFLGVTQVPKATGIEILNEAVDRLVSQVRTDRWILADVSIAPSTITITEVNGNQIAQCRVRYLSFLGIGRDVKHCAFIMHTSSENYMCYVFHVEPSAGLMAKTIEAACKLRYQKVLDAHTNGQITSSGKVLSH